MESSLEFKDSMAFNSTLEFSQSQLVFDNSMTLKDSSISMVEQGTKLIDDSDMMKAVYDDIKVVRDSDILLNTNMYDENKEKVTNDYVTNLIVYRINGCSWEDLNGKYKESGTYCGALRYVNVRGFVLYRECMREIPELGIYADGCYNAKNVANIMELMNTKAGN